MALLAARTRPCVFWSRLLPRSSVVPQKTHDRNVAVKSEQFPEFSLIFDFEKIRAASRVNKIKLQFTRLNVAGVPAIFAAQQFGYVSMDFLNSFIFFGEYRSLMFNSSLYFSA